MAARVRMTVRLLFEVIREKWLVIKLRSGCARLGRECTDKRARLSRSTLTFVSQRFDDEALTRGDPSRRFCWRARQRILSQVGLVSLIALAKQPSSLTHWARTNALAKILFSSRRKVRERRRRQGGCRLSAKFQELYLTDTDIAYNQFKHWRCNVVVNAKNNDTRAKTDATGRKTSMPFHVLPILFSISFRRWIKFILIC